MKILYVSPEIPWPLDRGNRVRIYNFLKELSSKHEVDAIFAIDRNYALVSEARNELAPYCNTLHFVKQQNWGIFSRGILCVGRLITYYLLGIGSTEFYHNLWRFNNTINRYLLIRQYDILVSNYWYTAISAITNAKCPIICDTHDVIWENASRLSATGSDVVNAWFRRRYINRLKRMESKVLNKYHFLLCVTARDGEILQNKLSVTTPSDVITTIRMDNRLSFQLPVVKNDNILFFGALHSQMNIDAARYAALDLFPEIKRMRPGAKLIIAGSGAGPEIIELGKIDGVTIKGYEADLESIFHDAKILFLPLRMGSGVKGRVLESMEAGLPVIGTSIMCEGIPAIHGKSIIVSDDSRELVYWAVKLMEDESLRCSIAKHARDFVTTNYSWNNTYGRIHKILDDVVSSGFAKN